MKSISFLHFLVFSMCCMQVSSPSKGPLWSTIPFKADLKQKAMRMKDVAPHGAVERAPKTADPKKLLGK